MPKRRQNHHRCDFEREGYGMYWMSAMQFELHATNWGNKRDAELKSAATRRRKNIESGLHNNNSEHLPSKKQKCQRGEILVRFAEHKEML